MQFKFWLESIEQRDNLHSWLDPQGNFHPVVDSHHTFMRRYLAKVGGNPAALAYADALEHAFKKGWFRITYTGGSLLANNDFVRLNPIQKRELVDLAITTGMREVIEDHDGQNITIWTAEDRM